MHVYLRLTQKRSLPTATEWSNPKYSKLGRIRFKEITHNYKNKTEESPLHKERPWGVGQDVTRGSNLNPVHSTTDINLDLKGQSDILGLAQDLLPGLGPAQAGFRQKEGRLIFSLKETE